MFTTNLDFKVIQASKNSKDLKKIAKKRGIKYPSTHLAFFKSVYAEIEKPNKNRVRLSREAVEDGLTGLVGCQINFNHWRESNICGQLLDAWINKEDEIEIAFTFHKSVYPDEYKEALELLEKDELTVSFELRCAKEDMEYLADGTKRLNKVDFDGVGLLMGEKPACPAARVFETAKQRILDLIGRDSPDLVFAKEAVINCKDLLESINKAIEEKLEVAQKWTRKFINSLPDSSFAVIEPAYLEGETKDKRARHLPFKNKDGKVDLPHYRNALARVNQIKPITDSISAEELRKKAKAELDKYRHLLKTDKGEESMDAKNNEALIVEFKKQITEEPKEEEVKEEEKKEDISEEPKEEEKEEVKEEAPAEEKPAEEKKEEEAQSEKAEKMVIETEMKQKVTDTIDNENNQETIKVETEMKKTVDGQPKEERKVTEEVTFTYAEVEAIKAEYEEKLKAKDEEIVKIRENATKIATLRAELGKYADKLSDEDLLNEDKVNIARLKKENTELKNPNDENSLETATEEDEKIETGHDEVPKEEEKEDKVEKFLKHRYNQITKK